MRPDPVVEFWLGMGAIAAALAVALLLAFPPAWMDHRIGAVANFGNVSFLGEGSSVSGDGYVWGTVTKIEPVKGHYRVHMKLKPGLELAANQGLALEQANPLQPAYLTVVRQCKAVPGVALQAGCCPERLSAASPEGAERGLASCGRIPNLIDQAKDIGTVAKTRIDDIGKTVSALNAKLGPLMDKASATLDTSKATMTSAGITSARAQALLANDNVANLSKVLASTQATMDRVKTTSATIDDLLQNKKEQLDASITNLSNVLATTAATMPGVVDNLQKSAEDLRAITGQIRQEPTSLVRRRERSDPSFVDPAPEK